MKEAAGNRKYYIKAVELKNEIVLITLADKDDPTWSITVHSNGDDIASVFSHIQAPSEYKQVVCEHAHKCKQKECPHHQVHDQGQFGLMGRTHQECRGHWCDGDPKKEATWSKCITSEVREQQDIRTWHNVEGEHFYS